MNISYMSILNSSLWRCASPSSLSMILWTISKTALRYLSLQMLPSDTFEAIFTMYLILSIMSTKLYFLSFSKLKIDSYFPKKPSNFSSCSLRRTENFSKTTLFFCLLLTSPSIEIGINDNLFRTLCIILIVCIDWSKNSTCLSPSTKNKILKSFSKVSAPS